MSEASASMPAGQPPGLQFTVTVHMAHQTVEVLVQGLFALATCTGAVTSSQVVQHLLG